MRKSLLILFSVLLYLATFAQGQIRVTGKVTSAEDGKGVFSTVLLKGTSKGASTDLNGAYSLDNVPQNGTLIFSALGYKKLEIQVKGRGPSVG
ncbi:carboxypeptidase-like regulatory domain-containing protein [Arcticibacter tournemirensis]|uniref:Carboxypeptidase-like regulatory domain-containing protein n=1 Tax=Arcticibacter tournemirensis TaxID=699437 RepID=A0A5M9HE28_9SPHI|nr:carboxypeptidase-like regulatory domain-containing protein [Arcticibacter tournemirensis]KAA8483157.1 carboxypeptidase-like regulatory domain-containing protein [Arcticibacter tournemirensis]